MTYTTTTGFLSSNVLRNGRDAEVPDTFRCEAIFMVHDYVFAFVSHLPHVIAYSLINSFITEDDCEDILRFSGGSLSDYTRIASSSPQMWRDVFSSNKDNVLKAISNFKNSLSEMEEAIRNDDRGLLENVIKKAYKARRENVK